MIAATDIRERSRRSPTRISPRRNRIACRRSELASANIGTNCYGYAYDTIGNRLWSAENATTNTYTANNLNQYSSILRASASPREVLHDADGNMLSDGDLTFTYDAANRLKTVSSNGVLIVTNFYDAKSRRVKKETQEATTTFFYDGWNLVEERISYTNGTTSTIRYYWGKDLSGTLQGAGGVGGLLYLTIDGVPYVPNYDNIGNITRYLDANGNTVAQYTYDAFGGTLSQSGSLASFFRHRFSTKYLDVETDLYYYGYRFYHPALMRWLNRDPIEEDGGVNIYAQTHNNLLSYVDHLGLAIIVIRHLPGTKPPTDWLDTEDTQCLALTVYKSPTYNITEVKYPGGKISFKVDVNPPNSFVDVYFRTLNDFLTKMEYEKDHISVARRHEQAFQDFKRAVEAIYDCPKPAREAANKEENLLKQKVQKLREENKAYDAPGGPHVLQKKK